MPQMRKKPKSLAGLSFGLCSAALMSSLVPFSHWVWWALPSPPPACGQSPLPSIAYQPSSSLDLSLTQLVPRVFYFPPWFLPVGPLLDCASSCGISGGYSGDKAAAFVQYLKWWLLIQRIPIGHISKLEVCNNDFYPPEVILTSLLRNNLYIFKLIRNL